MDGVQVPALEVNIYPWHTVNVMNFMNDLNCWFISTAQKTTSHFFKFTYKKCFKEIVSVVLMKIFKRKKHNTIMAFTVSDCYCPFYMFSLVSLLRG